MIERSFTVSGPADLDISVPAGSVKLDSGPPGRVSVTVDTRQPDAWLVSQAGDSITVAYDRGMVGRGGRARVLVIAPEGSSVRVYTASADLRARLELDRVTVQTASGDVFLGDAGTATIKTASGDVLMGSVDRDLTVRSASGDVRVSSVGEAASLTTASGDVLLERAGGPISCSSASGDVRVGDYRGDDLEASTMSGDMVVGLPSGRTVKLNAKTLSGTVHLPERRPTESTGGHPVSIRLKTVSGDITIRRVE